MDWSEFFSAVAFSALILLVAVLVESAREVGNATPPANRRREQRDDINQAGRNDWEDFDDGGE